MQDYLYSVIGLLAIGIQLIINFRVMFRPESVETQKAGKKYRLLMLSIFAYYITDALWGILAGLNWIPLLFIDTTIYYVAMASVILFFYRYIVEYLGMKSWVAGIFDWFGICFFAIENLCLIINIFVPCFFWFNEQDAYVAGTIRYIALWVQVAMFAFSSVVTFLEALKASGVNRKRNLAIFFFSLSMLIAIIFQERYPLLPFYALGCLIGCCVLHVYVVGDEIEAFSNQLLNYKRAVLSDAVISIEANLTKDELYYGVWKDDDGNEIPLVDIIGLEVPCSYDNYVQTWKAKFVHGGYSVDFSEKNDREYLLDSFSKGITDVTFDYAAKTISGNETWLRRNISMIQNQSGDIIAFTSAKDISALVDQTKKEESYIRALSTQYDGIAVVGIKDNQYTDGVSLQRQKVSDFTNEIDSKASEEEDFESKLKTVAEFVYPEDREYFKAETRKEAIFKSFANNTNHVLYFRFKNGEKDSLYYQTTFVPLRDDEGEVIGMIVCERNIDSSMRKEFSDRQELEAAKVAAEAANQAKSAFLFNMSHDIRTPMNAILGYTGMARKKTQEPEVEDYLEKIDIAGNQLLSLVNQVLEMSRIESGKIVLQEQKTDVEDFVNVIRTVYGEQAKAKGIDLTVEAKNLEHKHAIGDNDRLFQIANNLIGNALKYTLEGGSVRTTVEEESCGEIGYSVYRLTVEDTGIGISEEYLPHIFEEFSREKNSTANRIQGTGLGMSIVKKLVSLMGGAIDVSSKQGVGS